MDVKETNTILRYKRPCDSWLCPDCDTENNISLGKCTVCGCKKSPSATILKQWTEADDRPVTPPKKTPTPSGPAFKDTDKDDYIPEDENKNKIIWGIIIAIIIIGLIIAASQGSTYAAYSDAMNEFNCGNYETAMTMFEDLPSSYKDVSYMLDESKYQCATEYLNSGDFTSAESLFESISYHGDQAEKINECKYQAANGSSHTSYSLATSDGTYYKLEYGIHYKGNDYHWKKQWIYQKIDSNKVQVYNYIDGMIYTLSKNKEV